MRPTRSFRSRLRKRMATAFLLSSLIGAAAHRATAQEASDEVTPEVQRLYAEAKSAQQQGNPEAAIAKYRAMLKLAPHLAAAYNNLGMLYFNQRDYKNAAQTLRKGLAVDPGMNTASAMLGISEFKLGRNEEAKAALWKALAANPSDDLAEITLARVLIVLNEFEPATARLRAYLQRNPKDQQAWYLLGKTYVHLSEDALGRINAIDPNSVTAHEVAGEIDESMHNYDGALGEYKKAVDLAPQQPGTHFHLGNDFWLLGKWRSARDEFDAELKNDPENCTAHWKFANALLADNGDPKEALPHLDKAIERCPDLMQARVDRANALIKLEQPTNALPDLLLAEKDSPREPSIHFLLSKAYKALGRTDEARVEIETYGKLQREASEAVAGQASDVLQIKSTAH